MPMNLLIADRDGFSPQISRLIGMMDYTRHTTLEAVRGLSVEELDLRPEPYGNSVGMLLEHFVAVEIYYQALSFGTHADPEEAVGERWMPGLDLGQLGREKIKGHPLSYYLHNLAETRAQTLKMLAEKDDIWLEEPLPFWGQTGNRYFMWFHVFEDELNHRGQIRMLRQHMPRLQNRGLLGAGFDAATLDGLGMRCTQAWEGSPAALAGLQVGDVVLEYDGQDITHTPYMEIALERPAGQTSRFRVRRGDEVLNVDITRVSR